ncbi:GNAT family N-acetyltransferase [Chelatococcus sp. SYSU_G07232]|uniref:GNAT family N-acetyltransferase n=1 Tax=Chelatococcus albus TaxID=3047466 RepID=A0ABT7ADG7_9HYPH|nr:GNAT family N-acetyltransferase [Chelatococcus sp. SYSU_G07232]MDJ1157388.1 GNAT family N-acetyltransferase [Chelatococcus sp. SYSU_G07232]
MGEMTSINGNDAAAATARAARDSTRRLQDREAPSPFGGGGRLHAERRRVADLAPVLPAWQALAAHALDRNIFCEPAFAFAAARHLDAARELEAILVWDEGRSPALLGFFPLPTARRLFPPGLLGLWRSELAGLGTPLVAHARAEEILATFLDAVGAYRRGAAVLLPRIEADGGLARALDALAVRTGRGLWRFEPHARAVLPAGAAPEATLSGKKLKELRRQLRRLDEIGEVRFERARAPAAVAAAVERFLTLEAAGWKSARGTALLQRPDTAAFVRATMDRLALEERASVDLLMAGDRLVAAGLLLESGHRAWFWKIAYDEAFARFSPGVQLTLELARRQLQRGDIALTDSCAIADHPMIDHLWRDRMDIVDLCVAVRPGASPAASLAAWLEGRRRRLRVAAKHAYYRFKGGKIS